MLSGTQTQAAAAVESLRRTRFRVYGSVQGVGFRPFIHNRATAHDLTGWVLNDTLGVLIEVEGAPEAIDAFIEAVRREPPVLARVRSIQIEEDQTIRNRVRETFKIEESEASTDVLTEAPADAHVCDDCTREMHDPSDRRYRYPFINCTNCGPRYSLIRDLPYDRVSTTMTKFEMCVDCYREYHDPEDRRFHAQPTACPVCGPRLAYHEADGTRIDCADAVLQAIEDLKAGKVLAVKSVGGFHLVVDACNPEAVDLLRRRKKRDSKPFALATLNLDNIRQFCEVGEAEAQILEDPARPIVVLRKRPPEAQGIRVADNLAPRNPNLGVMLPSAPLHVLMLEDLDLPVLVMTSGNISGKPIVYENETALEEMGQIADRILLHDRDIETRVDDSLVRVSRRETDDEPVLTFLRRSRGFAPNPIHFEKKFPQIIAYGAELKTTLAVSKANAVYLSQHIGDLKNDETFESHQACGAHMTKLLDIEPEAIAIDMHPQFRSSIHARTESDLPVVEVQHHHAHMASCLLDNGVGEPSIGVIMDGMGFGPDYTVWGGEILMGDFADYKRAAHLRPFIQIGGDKAVKNPIRIALALLQEAYGEQAGEVAGEILPQLSEQERHVFLRMGERRINSAVTTSAGRLFDGVSSLLGICDTIEYEAQAAIEMEGLLGRDFAPADAFDVTLGEGQDGAIEIDYRPMIRQIVDEVRTGRASTEELSRRFHSTMVAAIVTVCKDLAEKTGIPRVAMSGGVFGNEYLLLRGADALAEAGLQPLVHREVPCNDGGIALGQVAVAAARLRRDG